MRMFLIKKGTRCRAMGRDARTQEVTLKRDATYDLEQVVVDPIGKMGVGPKDARVIGGAYAEAGWYGFELPANDRGLHTLLVPGSRVEVL